MRNKIIMLALMAVSIALGAVALALGGCTDAEYSDFKTLNKSQHVELFSGGKLVGQWDSTGTVVNSSQSDGYYFMDAKTHTNVRVSGTVIVTIKASE